MLFSLNPLSSSLPQGERTKCIMHYPLSLRERVGERVN